MIAEFESSFSKPKIKFCQSDLLTLFALLFFVTFLYFSNVDNLALLDPDEPRYASSASDMVKSGNWIVPYFNGQPRLNKPPFFYWITGLSFTVFNISEFSARLPSLVFGIGGIVVAFLWTRLMWDRWRAFCVGFFLAVCPLYLCISRLCITDMTMSFFLYLSLYFFYIGYEMRELTNRNKILIYFCLAMMFLTKGHVGIILFFLIVFVFLVTMRDVKYLSKLWCTKGLIVFASIVLPWSIMFVANVGMSNAIDLVSNETYGRFVGGYQHPEPFYFYIPVFLFGFFPWSFFIPLVFWFSLKIKKWKDIGIVNPEFDIERRETITRLKFFAVWFFVVLFFFSMSSSKLFTYILPMAPTVPILFILMFSNIKFEKKHLDYSLVLSTFISLFVFSLVVLIFIPKWISPKYLESDKIKLALWLFCFLMAFTTAVFVKKGFNSTKYFLGFTAYLLLVFLTLNVHVFIGDNRSTKNLVNEFLPMDRSNYELYCYRKILPSLIFYTGGTVEKVDPGEINSMHLKDIEDKDIYLYMKNKDYRKRMEEIKRSDFIVIGKNEKAVIFKKPNLKSLRP